MNVSVAHLNRLAISLLIILQQCTNLLPDNFVVTGRYILSAIIFIIAIYLYDWTFVSLGFAIWIALFFVLCAATLFYTVDRGATMVVIRRLPHTYLVAFVLSQSIRTMKDFTWALKSLMWGGLIYCSLIALFQGIGNIIENGINLGLTGGSIMLYTYVSIPTVLLCAFFLFTKENNKLYLPLTILAFFLNILSERRKSVLLPLIFIILFVFLKDGFNRKVMLRKIFRVTVALGVAALFIFISIRNATLHQIFGYRLQQLFLSFAGEENVSGSLDTRYLLRGIGMEYLKNNNPLTGVGLGNFRTLNRWDLHAHNNYLELLCTAGLAATICFYSIYVVLVKGMLANLSGKYEILFISMFVTNLIGDYSTTTYTRFFVVIYFTLGVCYLSIRDKENKAVPVVDHSAKSTGKGANALASP